MKFRLRQTFPALRRLPVALLAFLPLLAHAEPDPARLRAELNRARQLIQDNAPGKAAEVLSGMLSAKPDDPWLIYNTGVAAYAQKDFTKANDIWEQLAGTPLPPNLLSPTWTQIGNVSYRLVQDTIASEPDQALSGLEQSREAYRVALAHEKHNKIAAENLALVEKELEKIHSRLAQRLVAEARKESQTEKAIDKLQAALDHQQSANELGPKDAAHADAQKQIEQMLAEKFDDKAAKTEKQADQADQSNRWQSQHAREQLETALADFQQAETYDPKDQIAKDGAERIQKKLADALAQEGRREQHEAENDQNSSPERALDHFDAALQNFEQALALQPKHEDAQKGEDEVKKEMEKIHLEQGDHDQQVAEEEAKHSPDQAAGKMLSALEHFEQAHDLDPQSKPIQDRIDRVEQELPAMLMAMSKREQQEAAQAEPKSPEGAVAHLERAETALDKTEQLEPQNQEAQDMQKEVQADLARLRQLLAQQAEQQAQQQQQQAEKGQEPKDQSKFGEMLSNAKATQDQKEMYAHHQPPHKYDPAENHPFRNW